MVLKKSSEIKQFIQNELIMLGYDNIDLNDYSDILIKNVPKSEALSGDTHQTHIAITGESKAMFPVLLNLYYYEKKDPKLKSKDLPKIKVILLKKNLQYMGIHDFDSMGEEINTFTVSKVSSRADQESQIELGDMSVDGKEFLTFRKSLKEGDYLIILKNALTGVYIFICLRKNETENFIGKKGFYSGEENKIIHEIEIELTKDLPITLKKLDENFEDYVKKNQIKFLTFHPAYSYQEFIEGISFNDSDSKYIIKDGVFKEFCINAIYRALRITDGLEEKFDISNPRDYSKIKEEVLTSLEKGIKVNWEKVLSESSGRFCLIIDEINRGDIAKIFGELITLLEKDKRIGGNYEIMTSLPYSREKFGIPANVFILGTMNTADRSIALIDIALRRRFGFIGLSPDFSESSALVQNLRDNKSYEITSKSIKAVQLINSRLKSYVEIGKDKCIGHSFFFEIKDNDDIDNVWLHEIIPLLDEYCYSDLELLDNILFGENKHKSLNDFLTENQNKIDSLLDEIISSHEKVE